MEKQDRILVAGIGNTIRGDDGIGIYLTRRLKKVLPSRFDVKELSAGGLDLMQAISGYDKAILIDAIQTSGGATGEVYRLSLEDFKHSSNLSSTHALGLKEAVKLGIELAAEKMPRVDILAIEAKNIDEFREGLSPKMEKRFNEIVDQVRAEIEMEN